MTNFGHVAADASWIANLFKTRVQRQQQEVCPGSDIDKVCVVLERDIYFEDLFVNFGIKVQNLPSQILIEF